MTIDQLVALLGPYGLAAPLIVFMYLSRRECREDLKEERDAHKATRAELTQIAKDSIKSELTTTLILEKIADKVGA